MSMCAYVYRLFCAAFCVSVGFLNLIAYPKTLFCLAAPSTNSGYRPPVFLSARRNFNEGWELVEGEVEICLTNFNFWISS